MTLFSIPSLQCGPVYSRSLMSVHLIRQPLKVIFLALVGAAAIILVAGILFYLAHKFSCESSLSLFLLHSLDFLVRVLS